MARIRSIKPEYWSDATIATFDYFTRLFYIALWNFADDAGRGRALCRELAGFAFPLDDDLPNSEVERALQTIAASGRITLYDSSGVRHFQIVKWEEHQRVNRPSESRLPEPPKDYHGKSHNSITDRDSELSCDLHLRNLESGSGSLESGSGSEERVNAPTRPASFNQIETEINPAEATQISRGDPGDLLRKASQLLGRSFNLNSVERKEWSDVARMLLEQFSLEQVLECLRDGILRSAELKKKYRFAYLAKDVPDYFARPNLSLAREGVAAIDAERAERESQERANADREREAGLQAEREERRRIAKAAVSAPPPQ